MPKKSTNTSEPKFPYTTEPKALRRLLAEIPKRPKPLKLTFESLKAWNVSQNNNARTAITVIKKLGFLGPSGEPTAQYVEFMKTGSGPAVLAASIRSAYRVLFENTHAPQNEGDEQLKNLFHIHSGGGDDVMRLQVQTFKALCEYANFSAADIGNTLKDQGSGAGDTGDNSGGDGAKNKLPPIQIDLHIHLPEGKSTREYEAIIQDIAKYIYGRDIVRA